MAIRITPLSMSIVVFALTLGFLMRERLTGLAGAGLHARRAGTVSAAATGAPQMPDSVRGAVHMTPAPAEPAMSADSGKPPVASAAPFAPPNIQTEVQVPETEQATPESPPQTVPVTLAFHRGEGSDPKDVRLQNLSNAPLSVSITTTDPATRTPSMVQVTIAPHRRADLLAAGLSIHTGDEVRITSPQYSDLVLTAQ